MTDDLALDGLTGLFELVRGSLADREAEEARDVPRLARELWRLRAEIEELRKLRREAWARAGIRPAETALLAAYNKAIEQAVARGRAATHQPPQSIDARRPAPSPANARAGRWSR